MAVDEVVRGVQRLARILSQGYREGAALYDGVRLPVWSKLSQQGRRRWECAGAQAMEMMQHMLADYGAAQERRDGGPAGG